MSKSGQTGNIKLVAVIHAPALPGAPLNRLPLSKIEARLLSEAKMLEDAGFEALIVENFGDVPFYKEKVSPVTLSAMAILTRTLVDSTKLSVGVNLLRNDGIGALAIAVTAGAKFIRVNVLSGVFATDQGIIEGCADALMRERAQWAKHGKYISVWADVLVKHARCLSQDDPAHAAEELVHRAGADALILTGPTTGRAVASRSYESVSELNLRVPLFLGSGTNSENLKDYSNPKKDLRVIVGSAIRKNGIAGNDLDNKRIQNYVKKFRQLF